MMPRQVRTPEAAGVEQAINPKQLLKDLNKEMEPFNAQIKLAREYVFNQNDAPTVNDIGTIVGSVTPAAFNGLEDDAARLELLRSNQRDMALMIREMNKAFGETQSVIVRMRAALAALLRRAV
jgi:uncharacterized coiled-coil protein SlyX